MNKVILVVLVFLGTTAIAQHQYSVSEAQEYGSKNNTEIRNALLDVKYAKKQIKETRAIGLPHLNAELQWQKFIDIPTSIVPANAFNPNAPANEIMEMKMGMEQNVTAAITASQLIFDGSYIIGLKAATTFKKMAEHKMNLTNQQIKDSIAIAYYNVLIINENKKFLKSIVEVHQQILKELQATHKQGFIEDIEVDRMAIIVSTMKIQAEEVKRFSEISYMMLKMMLNIPFDEELILTDSLDNLLAKGTDLQLQEATIENRFEYKMSEAQTTLMKLDLIRYKTAWIPSIAAFGAYSENAMRNEFNFTNDGSWYPTKMIGIKASMPIFNGFSGSALTQKAKIKHLQSLNDLEHTRQALVLDYKSSESAYLTALSSKKNQENNLRLYKKIYLKTLAKYKEGLVGSSEVATGGADYLQAQTDYSKSIQQLLITKMKYNRTLGLN